MMTKKNDGPVQIGGMLGEGVRIEGTLEFNQTFRVDGEFKGKIQRSDRLVVGEKGRISGEVEVNIGPLLGANPRGLVFLEVPSRSLAVSGSTTNYADPWGRNYQAKFDHTYRNLVVPPDRLDAIPVGVVVWSYGPGGSTSNVNDWVKTW